MERFRWWPMLMLWLALAALPLPASGFSFEDVIDKARALADESYQAPTPIPAFLRELTYEQYQGIRFKPENSLWIKSDARFQVMLMSPGLYFKHPVVLHEVDEIGRASCRERV